MTDPVSDKTNWLQRAADLEALGLMYLEQARYGPATRLLLDAVALHEAHGDDDGCLPVATYLGVALYEHGKLEQALAIWEEVLSRGWKLPTVYALLERHYTRRGSLEEVERIRKARERAEPREVEAGARAADAGGSRSTQRGGSASGAGHRVLVADDEAGVRGLVVRFLEGIGYEVEVAADGVETLQAIMNHDPDLVILDVYMPRMSGLDVLLRIRDDGIETPVIVVSGFPEDTLVDAVLEHGAVFLAKPISLRELRRLSEAELALIDVA